MAESFANKSLRRVGVTSSVHTASIAAASDRITNISTFNVAVGALVDATQFIGGTRVLEIVSASNFGTSGEVRVDSTSSNVSTATVQTVGFNSVTAIDTATDKSILIGGTLANNTDNQLKVSVILSQQDNEHINVIHDVPIPAGSSLVLSDAGKLVVGIGSTLSIAVNADQGIDASISLLRGVS